MLDPVYLGLDLDQEVRPGHGLLGLVVAEPLLHLEQLPAQGLGRVPGVVDRGRSLDHLGPLCEFQGRKGLLEGFRAVADCRDHARPRVAAQGIPQEECQLAVPVWHVAVAPFLAERVYHHAERAQRFVYVAGLF